MEFCPRRNFQSIEASNFKLHKQIDHIKKYKNNNFIPLFLELLPLVYFNFGFLSRA